LLSEYKGDLRLQQSRRVTKAWKNLGTLEGESRRLPGAGSRR
jgi:hypothetical protein